MRFLFPKQLIFALIVLVAAAANAFGTPTHIQLTIYNAQALPANGTLHLSAFPKVNIRMDLLKEMCRG